MISKEQAELMMNSWVAAWNAHDFPAILSHYSEDFEMTSPYIVQFTGEPSGTLKGKAAVGAYWQKALEKYPDMHFEILHVLRSTQSVTLIYRSSLSGVSAEVFFINEAGKIFKAAAHYGS